MNERTIARAIAIVVNGESREVEADATIERFLVDHEIDPDVVVVERNGRIVPRRALGSTALEPADRLEIVHFVGGG